MKKTIGDKVYKIAPNDHIHRIISDYVDQFERHMYHPAFWKAAREKLINYIRYQTTIRHTLLKYEARRKI